MHYATSSALTEFDRWSRSYDRSLLQRCFFGPSHDLILQQMTGADRRVLDIGCGTGRFAERVLRHFPGTTVWGIDLSSKMLQHACERAHSWKGCFHRVQGDSERLPFRDGAFDVVTCSHSFHHYPNQDAAVVEMFRVLRPGGRLILVDGDRDRLWGWFIFDVIVTLAEWTVHHCSSERLRGLFARAGFEQVRQLGRGGALPFLLTTGLAGTAAVAMPALDEAA